MNRIDVRLQFDTLFVKSGVKYLSDFSDNLQLFLNLEGGFLRTIEHMSVVVAGTIVSEVTRDLPTYYASCPEELFKLIPKSTFTYFLVKLSSEEFSDLLDRFTMTFHKLKGIDFTVPTQLKMLDCMYIQTFFQTLHKSTLVKTTKIVDMCLNLLITCTCMNSSDNGIAYMTLYNFTSNKEHILTPELSTRVTHDYHMHTTQNCTNEQLCSMLKLN